MAETLKHRTQRALSAYRFCDVDHPLYAAWSDYQYARATRRAVAPARRRLVAALSLETALAEWSAA